MSYKNLEHSTDALIEVRAPNLTKAFEVAGKCEMCKERIESALDVKGVRMAYWSEETKICKVTYNPAKISEKEIYKIVAKAGHDTKACKATDEAYNGLYHCCHYERPDYSK